MQSFADVKHHQVNPQPAEQIRIAENLKEALLKAYAPEAIILFGSLGRGDGDEFSDVDLLLVMETDRDEGELSREMAEYLDPITKDKHIIVRTPRDYCRRRDIPGTIVYSAEREGKVLFDKKGWRRRNRPVDSYEARKKEVIRREYVQASLDFLAQAETSLGKGNLYRCRDFLRFAAARVLKGIFVLHNIHPPRDTDLDILLNRAKALEVINSEEETFARELNCYFPASKDSKGEIKTREMLYATARFVQKMLSLYGDD